MGKLNEKERKSEKVPKDRHRVNCVRVWVSECSKYIARKETLPALAEGTGLFVYAATVCVCECMGLCEKSMCRRCEKRCNSICQAKLELNSWAHWAHSFSLALGAQRNGWITVNECESESSDCGRRFSPVDKRRARMQNERKEKSESKLQQKQYWHSDCISEQS